MKAPREIRAVALSEGLASRDARRNLDAELLRSVREMKAGKGKVVARVEVPAVTLARMKSGLSQAK